MPGLSLLRAVEVEKREVCFDCVITRWCIYWNSSTWSSFVCGLGRMQLRLIKCFKWPLSRNAFWDLSAEGGTHSLLLNQKRTHEQVSYQKNADCHLWRPRNRPFGVCTTRTNCLHSLLTGGAQEIERWVARSVLTSKMSSSSTKTIHPVTWPSSSPTT